MDIEVKSYNQELGQIKIIKNGIEVNCKIIFTFDSEETMRRYVGFTDNSLASNGRENIYVKSYNPFSKEIKFEDILDEKEFEMINDVLYQIDGGSD